MKKFLISLFIIIGLIAVNKSKITIPKDAIRVRVIAASDSSEDQKIKKVVKSNLEDNLYYLLKDVKEIGEARNIINNNLSDIDNSISRTLHDNKFNINYKIDFGDNYFPKKEYKGVIYEEGMYESLVVTLGEGKGDNWWCVMFPPFCLIEAHDNGKADIEYKWAVKEIINKYFK